MIVGNIGILLLVSGAIWFVFVWWKTRKLTRELNAHYERVDRKLRSRPAAPMDMPQTEAYDHGDTPTELIYAGQTLPEPETENEWIVASVTASSSTDSGSQPLRFRD